LEREETEVFKADVTNTRSICTEAAYLSICKPIGLPFAALDVNDGFDKFIR
jgi:hypothetical protein